MYYLVRISGLTFLFSILFFTILSKSTIVQDAYVFCRPKLEHPEQIKVFIDPVPPANMDSVVWHNLVMRSLGEWLLPAGCTIVETKNEKEAQIRFETNILSKAYGRTIGLYKCPCFPYLPYPEDNIKIEIDTLILSRVANNVHRTLLHEIGHAIGLDHRDNSVMATTSPKPNNLTELDKQSIQEYKKYIESCK